MTPPLDWTDGEDEAMAYYRGESKYDPRPIDEEEPHEDDEAA